jgi:hypothetical protein
VGSTFFRVDGLRDGQTDRQTERQRDRTKLIVAFHNFANAPKNLKIKLLVTEAPLCNVLNRKLNQPFCDTYNSFWWNYQTLSRIICLQATVLGSSINVRRYMSLESLAEDKVCFKAPKITKGGRK